MELQADTLVGNIIGWLAQRPSVIARQVKPVRIGAPDDIFGLPNETAIGVCWLEEGAVERPDRDDTQVLDGDGEMVILQVVISIKTTVISSASDGFTHASAASLVDPTRGASPLAADILSKVDGIRKYDIGIPGDTGRCFLQLKKLTAVPGIDRKMAAAGPVVLVLQFQTSMFEQ